MNLRTKFLLGFISLLSLCLFFWSLSISSEAYSPAFRNAEFQKNAESINQLQALFAAGSPEDGILKTVARNMQSLQAGASLIEKDAILVFAFFSVIILATTLLTLFQAGLGQDSTKAAVASSPALDIEQTLRDLAEARQALAELSESQSPRQNSTKEFLERQSQPIAAVKVQLQQLKHGFEPNLIENKAIAAKLLQMSTQSEDNANYASTVRLEWNALGIRLRQLQEGTEKLMSRASGIQKQSVLSHDLLAKSQNLDLQQAAHTDKARSHVHQLYERSKETIDSFQTLIHSMSASNQDVSTANRLVRNLSDRAEEIVNIIDVIDDIAEQTNQLALNASIEAARAGEQGQGFAVVAAEVRNLAARSSTATRSITDLLETIQREAAEASSCLEKTHHSVNNAHGKIVEVNSNYHESLQLSRQTMDEFQDIAQVSRAFSEEVRSAERLQAEVKRDSGQLLKLLSEQQDANSKAENESNQLALHADRLSRFLNRQFYDIRHCERSVEGQTQALEALNQNIKGAMQHAARLHQDWEQAYASTLVFQATERKNAIPIARASSILEFSQRHLELLGTGSGDTAGEASEDDLDIRIDQGEKLKKAG